MNNQEFKYFVKTVNYGYIANSVMEEETISFGAKALYAYLISITGEEEGCYPPNDTIMKCLAIKSLSYLRKLKNELIAARLLTVEERKYKSGRTASNYYSPTKIRIKAKV